MIKNLNDLLSLVILIIFTLFSVRLLVFAFVTKGEEDNKVSRWKLLKEYNDNEEE